MNTSFKNIPHVGLYKFTGFILLGIIISYFVIPRYIYQYVWVILGFFFLLTLISLIGIEKFTKNKPDNFLAVYFSVMIGRLFISIMFAAVFILTDRDHVFNFSVNFLFLYLLFLGFEIFGIMTNLRSHFKKGSEND